MLTINEFKVFIVVLLEIALVRVLAVGEVAVAVALVEDGLQLLPAHVVVVPLQVVHHQPPRVVHVVSGGVLEVVNTIDVLLDPARRKLRVNDLRDVLMTLILVPNLEKLQIIGICIEILNELVILQKFRHVQSLVSFQLLL